ncbi:MAG TPA: glycosyltransferase family 2 protein [Firmicutes bacterium]|nr:glycosyltransferase family 2 protein [Bacillota bacterium]
MTQKPLISVIIPACGPPKRLARAIKSALNQDYDNIELIVVDDNGKGTKNQIAAEKLVTNMPPSPRSLRYHCHVYNKNGAAARNTGADLARGSYFALLDDDDYFYPHKLSAQMSALGRIQTAAKFSYTSFRVLSDGKVRNKICVRKTKDIPVAILLKKTKIPSSSLLISRECWEQAGGFDESFDRHQDWEFVIRTAQVCPSAAVEDFCFAKSVTRRNTPGDTEVFRRQRRHYLDTMKDVISRYPDKIQKKIYAVHTGDIALEYLRKKEWKETWALIKRSPNRLYSLKYIAGRIVTHGRYRMRLRFTPR